MANPIRANPLVTGDALANSLQPANVALAELIESVRRLEPAIRDTGRASNEATQELARSTFSLGNFASGLSRSTVLLGLATSQFSTFTSAVQSGIASAVGAFDPSAVKRWELTLRDLHAVFGDIFRPVLERANVVVRALADGIESLSPSSKTMVAALAVGAISMATMTAVTSAFSVAVATATGGLSLAAGAIAGVVAGVGTMALSAAEFKDTVRELSAAGSAVADELGRAAADLMKQLQPTVREGAKAATEMAKLAATLVELNRELPIFTGGIADLSQALRGAFAGVKPLNDAIRALFGLGPDKGVGGSEGKAVANVRFGSTQDVYRDLLKNAFSMSGAEGKKGPAEVTASTLEQIHKILTKWDGRLGQLGGVARGVGTVLDPRTSDRSNRAVNETPFRYLDPSKAADRLRHMFD